ncbi:MAG: hypothetical protein JW795_08735 [Chitinivibrionales bacterium]|nr:hypothetical protein [Chitinivibrionales bacterium]
MNKFGFLLGLCASVFVANAQLLPVDTVRAADIYARDTTHWTADSVHLMFGKIWVDSGKVLIIDSGTVVKGAYNYANHVDSVAVLIVCRNGKLYANGTEERPIIFTAEKDDVTKPCDVGAYETGLWGGIILLGRAPISGNYEQYIEGITNEPRAYYGPKRDGTGAIIDSNSNDNSGVVRYVSIRHGGAIIGASNEINGLTMGGVGAGTTIEFVEVYANLDDGFEWFGGTVNCKYLVSAFNLDDAFDYDLGYRGKGQFWFAIQTPSYPRGGNRCAEMDGLLSPNGPDTAGYLYSKPTIANVTYLGSGIGNNPKTAANLEGNDFCMIFREGAAGKYINSIFGDYNGRGIRFDNTHGANEINTLQRLADGNLSLNGCIFFNCGTSTTLDQAISVDPGFESYKSYITDAARLNSYVDPLLTKIDRECGKELLDPRPDQNGPAYQNLATLPTGFFTQVNYKGAFDYQWMWFDHWTALATYRVNAPMLIIAPQTSNFYQYMKCDLSFMVMMKNANSQISGTKIEAGSRACGSKTWTFTDVTSAFARQVTTVVPVIDPCTNANVGANSYLRASNTFGNWIGIGDRSLRAKLRCVLTGGTSIYVYDRADFHVYK